MSADTDTIAEFLTARYDEAEAKALAAARVYGKDWRAFTADPMRAMVHDADMGDPVVLDVEGAEPAEFIAAFDPRWVLADIAVKRKILAGHTWSTEAPHGGQGIARCVACITDRDPYPELWEGDPWPCKTVRLLAEPFSAHPDYTAGWAPPALTGICPGCNGTLHQGSQPWHWYHDDGNLSCPRRP